jgi:predicted RNA-binding Zn-ribbon protein involved in translation (DUF1610 family)/regulator of replication initiation timing
MARQKDLEAKLNNSTDFFGVLSLGSVVLSGILLFSPARAVGYIGIGSGLGAFTASVVTRRKHLQVARQHVNDLTSHHRIEVDLQNDLLVSKDNEIHTLRADNGKRFKKIEALNQELSQSVKQSTQLQNQVDGLVTQNHAQQQLIEKVTGELDRLLDTARVAVEESLDEWDTRLCSLVDTKREQYPKLAERLNQLFEEGQGLIADYKAKLSETPKKWNSLADLLSLYYVCNDDLQNIRVKAVQAIARLTNQETLLELQEYQAAIEQWEEAKLIPRSKVEGLIAKYEAMLAEFRTDLNQRFEDAQSIADVMQGELSKDEQFFLRLKSKIQELESEVHRLSKPLEWRPATRADMKVANIIIRYFEQLGVILDRAGTDYKGYEATLWFLPDRTGRLVLADELNEHSDKLQALSHTLNAPKFALEPESGLISVLVQLAKKPKADSKDIDRLWIPASQFEQTVKGWRRVRLTGGSESGKSPTAENLAVAILKNHPGVSKLFNPQHDSIKNYWTIPTVGTSHKDSEKGIADLAKQVDARANGEESRDTFELSIFDEVDSTMSHTKGKKSVIGGNVNFIIKQASHQNLGAIFIGQNANVSEYPGMDRSDWNSAVNVHIGANVYDAITNSNRFTSEEVSRLKQTADKITEFCNDKNTELGLEKTDPQAYRFALVIEPNKKPYFIELPAFGTYTYDQLQQHQHATPVMATATPDTSTQSLEPLQTRITSSSPLDIQSGYVESSCPGCGSTNRVKAGKYQERQRYQCKGCGKRYVEDNN